MINLLNGISAAVNSYVSRNSVQGLDEEESLLKKYGFWEWLYRNCCYYGMQIQRSVNRALRAVRRLARPAVRFTASAIRKSVIAPAAQARRSAGSICAELRAAKPRVKAASQAGAMAGMRERRRVLVSTAAAHKSFLASVGNTVLPIICITILAVTVSSIVGRNYALMVECDGRTVGYVGDESTYTEAASLVSERVLSTSEEFKSTLSPTYKLVAVDPDSINTSQEICDNILYSSENVAEAYGFFIDGKLLAAIGSEGDMSYILDEFLEEFKDGKENGRVSFVQETEVKKGLYSSDIIVESSEFKENIGARKMETQLYTVKSGDTLKKIAKKFGITTERICELNSDLTDSGSLKKGASLLVEKEQPVLAVKCVANSSYTKSIAYNTVTVKDASKYADYKKLKNAGQNGVKKITEEITYVDGVEVSRKVVKTEILKQAVDRVYVVGTKARPTTTKKKKQTGGGTKVGGGGSSTPISSTGRFTWPVPGVRTVSSRYGYRWGRLHKGIDISTGGIYGRTIVAADAGKVITSKYHRSYGYYIVIKHNSTYETLYAHCSKLLVSAGKYVSKGQAIGKVGSTGNSTGPHLHFEIRVNGTPKNPLNYY